MFNITPPQDKKDIAKKKYESVDKSLKERRGDGGGGGGGRRSPKSPKSVKSIGSRPNSRMLMADKNGIDLAVER